MPIPKEAGTLAMPWEQSYGYAQAVRVGDTIWVSGQLSHDNEGNIVGPGDMRAQLEQKRRGRIGAKALRPGRYRAVITAVDAAGNRSAPKTVRFRIAAR